MSDDEDVDWDELMKEHRMNQDQVDCPYCGKTFASSEDQTAYEKEGIHKSREHIDPDETIAQPDENNDKDLIDEFRRNNKRKASTNEGTA